MLTEMFNKNADIENMAKIAMSDKDLLREVLDALTSKEETLRYNCHKVLMHISENDGALIYPQWEYFVGFLDSDNSYRKISAVHLIASLTKVDTESKFDEIIDRYYDLLDDKSMIVAIYVAATSGKIVKAKPHLESRITGRLLSIDGTHHTEERMPLIKAGAIESFGEYFSKASDKEAILDFVRKQLNCNSPKTRKLARGFLDEWGNTK